MNINSRTSKVNFTGYASGAIASFTGLREAPIKLRAYINAIQEGSGDPAPDNIRPISGRDSITITANSIDSEISLGDTYYGGSLDVTTGVLTITMSQLIDLGDFNWANDGNGTARVSMTQPAYFFKGDIICDSYQGINSITLTDNTIAITNSQLYPIIRVKDTVNISDSASASDIKTFMTGKKACFELATPITFKLTPTQISQIIGSNSISSDAGNVEVFFVTI